MIMLLNLLIALMADTYAFFSKKKTPMYLLDIANIWESSQADSEKYSSLICAFTPLNLITAFFLPNIVFGLKPINRCFLVLEYLPIAIIGGLLFFVVSIVLLLPAYLASIINKVTVVIKFWRRIDNSWIWDFLDLQMFIFLGIPILALTTIMDLIYYTIHLFSSHAKLRNKALITTNLSEISIRIIELFLREELMQKKEFVLASKFVLKL